LQSWRPPQRLILLMVITIIILTAVVLPAVGQGTKDELNLRYDDPQPSNNPSMLGQLVQVVISLSLILGLALVLIRVFGRRATRMTAAGWMNVIDQVALAPNKGLYLTKIAGKYYVLGVTDHQITKVTEVDNPEFLPEFEPPLNGTGLPEWNWWKRLLLRLGRGKDPNRQEFHTVMEGQLERLRDLHPLSPDIRRLRDYR